MAGRGIVGAFGGARVRAHLALTGTLIALATLVYRRVEGWGWLDALIFSVVTIFTAGYGELVPQTVAGRIFTITMVYIFLSVASWWPPARWASTRSGRRATPAQKTRPPAMRTIPGRRIDTSRRDPFS